jgi:uncharacterized protein (TIGR02996 family)
MTDRADLLAAVCDRPDDDTPRLVFADWCDDHGDPDYARFIRAQVDLAGVPEWDRLRVRTWRREQHLVTGAPYRERYPLPPPGPREAPGRLRAWFRRGFPWDVEYESAGPFVRQSADLFARAPFQSVTIRHQHPAAADPAPLVADPSLARLRRLGFVGTRLGAPAVRRLANAPHLAGVTELSFESDAITSAGVAELFRSRLPGQLTRLHLPFADPIPADVLGGYDGPSSLRSLNLHYTPVVGPYPRGLFDAPVFRGLVELNLTHTPLGPAGVAALVGSAAATSLESFTLNDIPLGAAAVRTLTGSPALANLRRLSLSTSDLGPAAAKAIARSPHLRNLTVLDLAGNAIKDEGVLALAASPHLRNLAFLDLALTGVTDRGVVALLDSPVSANLERLDLHGAQSLSPDLLACLRERFG